MASNGSTPTLFSTYKKSSKIHRNYSRNGANSSRYVVGSVGKSCGKHLRFGRSGESSSGTSCSHSHANVAIATQVLNPSAIGGSLKNRRFVEHFGPKEDDEISFFSGKSRAVCSKVCFYGVSIGVTMIMITGLIVAVGYMQTEKERISTRPVKLAQQDFQSSTTHRPPAVLFGTTTTARPLLKDSDNEIINENDDDDMDEISVDDFNRIDPHPHPRPPHRNNLQNGIFNFKVSTSPDSLPSQNHHRHHHQEDFRSANNDDENNISDEDEYHTSTKPYGHHRDPDPDERVEDEVNTSPEEDLHHDIGDEEDNINPPEGGRPFSEVRVKPPSNFKFGGLSFEFPIYRVNTTTETITSATPTPTPSTTPNVSEGQIHDYHEESHPHSQNGLDESEIESGRSSASVTNKTPTSTSSTTTVTETIGELAEEETKELETSINHSNSNSGLNFTSLIDSQEEKAHENGNERGEVLFSDENKKDYANAKKYNTINPSHSQDDSSSSSSDSLLDLVNSKDFTQTKHLHFKPTSGDGSNYNYNSDRYNPHSTDLSRDDGILVKSSSRYSANTKNQNQNDKTLNGGDNDEDFAIEESTTSAVATLQTDIFDADEFQTSASEDSEIDAESDDKEEEHQNSPDTTPFPIPTSRPQKSNQKGNGNDQELTIRRPNSKGARRGKTLRPRPRPQVDGDYDETENTNGKTNGRIKDGKKLVLRPNKKFHGKVNGFGQGESGLNLKQDIQLDLGSGGSSPSTGTGSEEIPDLNYKIDFSRFISTTPTTPSENNDNIEYQPPNHGSNNPYPNFNLSPPPIDHRPFDLEEYLNKHAKKTGSTAAPSSDPDTSSFDTSSLISSPQTQTSSNLDTSVLSHQYESYKVDPTPSPLLYTGSSGSGPGTNPTTTLTLDPTTTNLNLFPQQDSQFSKRTFYNSESFSVPQNSNDNSFAHLLGPQAPSNHFGGVSATGATLNLFQPQSPSYNFEVGGSSGNFQNNPGGGGSTFTNNYNIPSFNALSASAQSNAQHGFSVDANGAFSLLSPSNLPYPNIPTGGGGGGNSNNYGGTGSGVNLGGNNYQNTFSFNNEPISSSSKKLVLTTGTGQVPTYNTITQGIHLLTLLSGRGGGGNSDNDNGNNGYDQFGSGSSLYPSIVEPDAPQGSANLADYNNNYNNGGGGSRGLNFNNGNTGISGFNSQNYQIYSQDLFPNKNFKNFDISGNDQDSSASRPFPSFSRSIALKAPDLDISGMVKAIQRQNLNWGQGGGDQSIKEMSSSPYQSLISSSRAKEKSNKSQPKSLSIRILSKSSKPKLTLTPTSTPTSTPPKTMDSSELESLAPKSRKRLLQPESDMEAGESRLHTIVKNGKNDPHKVREGAPLTSTTGRRGRHPSLISPLAIATAASNQQGLKSGFFN